MSFDLDDIKQALRPEVRLPDWPFVAPGGHVAICEYSSAIGGGFARVLTALCAAFGDESVTFVAFEPAPEYLRDIYGHVGSFRVPRGQLATEYAARLLYEPGGDPTGALGFAANVFGIAGTSNAWAIWGQRDWELAILLTPTIPGPWLDAGIPFAGPRDALHDFRGPEGWVKPLSKPEIDVFLSNVEEAARKPADPVVQRIQRATDDYVRPHDIHE
jgi:hypothetical protein